MDEKHAKARVDGDGISAEAVGAGALAVGTKGRVTAFGDAVAVASEDEVRAAASTLSGAAQEVFAEVGRLDGEERDLVVKCIRALQARNDGEDLPEARAEKVAREFLPPVVQPDSLRWTKLLVIISALAKLPYKEIVEFIGRLVGKM